MAKKITLRTKYDRVRVAVNTGTETHVKQAFKDESDINHIMAKYTKTGVLPRLIKENPLWGDFSNPVDFQEAQNIVIKATEQFAALPSHIRERFANDPAKFLAFTSDKNNKEEMGRLGLLKEDALKPKGSASNEGEKPTPQVKESKPEKA